MSSYLDEDSDDSDTGKTFSPEDQAGAKQVALESKESGNELFKAGTEESWDAAVKEYSTGVNALKAVGLGKGQIAVVRQRARTPALLETAGAGSDATEMERACDGVETVGVDKGDDLFCSGRKRRPWPGWRQRVPEAAPR